MKHGPKFVGFYPAPPYDQIFLRWWVFVDFADLFSNKKRLFLEMADKTSPIQAGFSVKISR